MFCFVFVVCFVAITLSSLSARELAARRKKWKPRKHMYQAGAIWKYAQLVGPARYGALTHPGGKAETHVYADI